VLPAGRKFGPITQQGPSKKGSGRTNPGPDFPEMAEKGAKFRNWFHVFTFFFILKNEKLNFSQILRLKG
jgi:hypothetical protein